MLWDRISRVVDKLFDRINESTRDGDPIWCVVANVLDEHPVGESGEIKSGTKHFSANTKVYCFPPLWGDGYEHIKVIGRHRGSKQFVEMVVPSKRLTNWRVKMVYSPFIVDRMKGHWNDSNESREKAAEIVAEMLGRNAVR